VSREVKLSALLAEAGFESLTSSQADRFAKYIDLFLRWNEKTNLSAIREEDEILRRHILESIQCARTLPAGLTSLLDFGSGGGLPGIPISILHPDIEVTLAESQIKKATFLNEVVRTLSLNAKVHSARAELLNRKFDCVTLRAVDKMTEAVQAASHLVSSNGWMVLMTTAADTATHQAAAGPNFTWIPPTPILASDSRLILLGHKN
jgi:16S rRNA (guanine527-N7)-methyltransferase